MFPGCSYEQGKVLFFLPLFDGGTMHLKRNWCLISSQCLEISQHYPELRVALSATFLVIGV